MAVLRAIGRFFARIGRWIKETAWIQPLLIVGGIFAIIFSIPHLTKWVKSWVKDESAAETYYSNKKLSLKKADKDHGSEVDELFNYLSTFADERRVDEAGKKKFGEKFFLAIVQENCSACQDRYGAFKTLENNWGKGESFALDGEDGLGNEPFKLHTIYADTKNDDGDNLFEKVYDRSEVLNFFETTISAMEGDAYDHPYYINGNESGYETNLKNLKEREEITTPAIFLIDLTTEGNFGWRSDYGVKEVLFTFDGTDGTDDYAKARTLRNAWTNNPSAGNVFSEEYNG
ncbi:MAG: hypothetical protein J5511_02915 [Bacilli bacterium]|nr:hypothetical protein [Bacilli bacterium]